MKTQILAATAAVFVLSAGVATAQSTDTAQYPTAAAPIEEDSDDGMDLGWIGLLGLAGLLGLRKRTETVRTHPTGTTSPR